MSVVVVMSVATAIEAIEATRLSLGGLFVFGYQKRWYRSRQCWSL